MTREELDQILRDRGMTKVQLMKLLEISYDVLRRMNRCTVYAIRYLDEYGMEQSKVRGKMYMQLWPGTLQELAKAMGMPDTQMYEICSRKVPTTHRVSMAFRWLLMEQGIET